MNVKRIIMLILPMSLAAGCLPEKRIIWSPDGSKAAVVAANGLYFVDDKGKVLEPRLKSGHMQCDWFPDGRRLAVIHTVKATKWSQIAELFSAEEVTSIKRDATALHERMLKYEGDSKKFDLDPDDKLPAGRQLATLLYVRDHDSDGLREKYGEEWDNIEKMDVSVYHLQVFELAADSLEPGEVLLRSLEQMVRPRIDPTGKHIAFLLGDSVSDDDAVSLWVVPAAGGKDRRIAPNVAIEYDWSPDGRGMAFIRCSAAEGQTAENVHLGSVTTARVAGPDGALLEEWAEVQDRVGLLFNRTLGVDWLSDGRLLFSSVELTLPATSRDMPQQWSLFVLDPRTPASVARVLARDFSEPLDVGLPLFEVSPDETKVLLPGPKGRLSLYEFASGSAVSLVSEDDRKGKLRSLPSWRNNSEITLVAPAPLGQAADEASAVFIWKEGQARLFSTDWPDELKEGWLVGE